MRVACSSFVFRQNWSPSDFSTRDESVSGSAWKYFRNLTWESTPLTSFSFRPVLFGPGVIFDFLLDFLTWKQPSGPLSYTIRAPPKIFLSYIFLWNNGKKTADPHLSLLKVFLAEEWPRSQWEILSPVWRKRCRCAPPLWNRQFHVFDEIFEFFYCHTPGEPGSSTVSVSSGHRFQMALSIFKTDPNFLWKFLRARCARTILVVLLHSLL